MNRTTRIALALLPLVALVGLITVFAVMLPRDHSILPSVFINKPAPAFELGAVDGLSVPGFDTAALQGEVTVVNIFGSWCIPCREEHPQLEALKARTGVRMFGINQKDDPQSAAAFLKELGNPYDAIGGDRNGRVSIDWGAYGVPETFIVDADGIVLYKYVGPIPAEALETEVIPAVEKAKAGRS